MTESVRRANDPAVAKQPPAGCVACGSRSYKLCDGLVVNIEGKLYRVPRTRDGLLEKYGKIAKLCSAPLCMVHAACVGRIHLNYGRKGCRWESTDLCPDCNGLTEPKPFEVSA